MWICQPLYAATIWDVDLKDREYEPILTRSKDSDTVEIKLQQVPPEDLCKEILSCAKKAEQKASKSTEKKNVQAKEEKLSFSARPDTRSPQFNFKKELAWLPFE